MNSNLNHSDNARLLSEVPAEDLAAIAGGINLTLWDSSSNTGVMFLKTGQILWSTGNGKINVLN
jgi:hypothetical protein